MALLIRITYWNGWTWWAKPVEATKTLTIPDGLVWDKKVETSDSAITVRVRWGATADRLGIGNGLVVEVPGNRLISADVEEVVA